MSNKLFRVSNLVRHATAASQIPIVSSSFVRTKVTLPDLAYDYGALEPAISGQIMELHHSKHHQTYVTSYNAAEEKLSAATSPAEKIALQPLLNFHGGGHINHSLFWENLSPRNKDGGGEPTGSLKQAVDKTFGSVADLKKVVNAKLAGIQGSGWAWLVQNTETGAVEVKTYANQDPVGAGYKPLLGIDAWEHAYYLQYQNRKAEYFNAIWDVVNWKTAEKRFSA